MNIQLPGYAKQLFQPKRYKVLYGGRGSAKSYSIARALLLIGAQKKIRVLCAREFQNSITESVHALLVSQCEELGLKDFYKPTQTSIIGKNGTEFIFKGVRFNTHSIKSMFGITHLWLEEASTVSQSSWDLLIPTIREPGSEIWVSFNPESEDDPTYKMFVMPDGSPLSRDDAFIAKVNWSDNPWFPQELAKEKNHLFRVDPDLAMHVWEGQCRRNSDAQIMKNKWIVQAFESQDHWDGPYQGADWGFSTDPTTLVQVYLDLHARKVFIRRAEWGVGVELDEIPAMFDRVPDVRHRVIRADNARPETISYIARKGFLIEAADKWTGSVEDGIAFLRSFEQIVIHPEAKHMIDEAKNYSYKVDRLTGDVTTIIVDKHNHCWDAVRYALAPMIQAGGISLLDVL